MGLKAVLHNKGMELTKPGQRRSFAAYLRCSTNCEESERVKQGTMTSMRRRRPGLRRGQARPRQQATSASSGQHVGFAWYRADQWHRLHELDAGATELHDRYEEWVAAAERSIVELASHGIVVERVPVDVDEIAEWCLRQGKRFDGAARSQFVVELLQKRATRQ